MTINRGSTRAPTEKATRTFLAYALSNYINSLSILLSEIRDRPEVNIKAVWKKTTTKFDD